jgi:hypothetical protein
VTNFNVWTRVAYRSRLSAIKSKIAKTVKMKKIATFLCQIVQKASLNAKDYWVVWAARVEDAFFRDSVAMEVN